MRQQYSTPLLLLQSVAMPDSHLDVQVFASEASLPPADASLFSDPREALLGSREWLRNFERNGIPSGSRIRLYGLSLGTDPALRTLLPTVYSRLYPMHPRAKVLHFPGVDGTPYAPWPVLATADSATAIERVIEFIHANRRGYDVLRFSPLEPVGPVFHHVIGALRRTGHPLHVYDVARTTYEPTSGVTANAYMAARPPGLREALDRAWRALADPGRAQFRLIVDDRDIELALRDFARMQSTDRDETASELTGYLPGLICTAARAGVLRLGFLDVDGAPAALQLWLISTNVAHCLRIVSVDRHTDLPLDDLLTRHIALHLIDTDGVAEFNFGMLNDDFAQRWASRTRNRVGIIAFNPRTWRGIKGTVRHVAIPRLLSMLRRIRRKLGPRRT